MSYILISAGPMLSGNVDADHCLIRNENVFRLEVSVDEHHCCWITRQHMGSIEKQVAGLCDHLVIRREFTAGEIYKTVMQLGLDVKMAERSGIDGMEPFEPFGRPARTVRNHAFRAPLVENLHPKGGGVDPLGYHHRVVTIQTNGLRERVVRLFAGYFRESL